MHPYKLSVLVTTYNHEKYIAEAIESVLDQKVDFPFEIVISDDYSTDRTRSIIQEYYIRYPSQIKLLLPPQNLGLTKNLQHGLLGCQGEYVAILEGDDYWLSRYKLQRQVAFLDQHPSCSFCFNGLLLLLEEQQIYREHQIPILCKQTFFTTQELILNNFISNFSTCMYRNSVIKLLPSKIYDVFTADWLFNITCSQFGSIGCIPIQMTAYRKHKGGEWSSKSAYEQCTQVMKLAKQYDALLDFRYTREFNRVIKQVKTTLSRSKFPKVLFFKAAKKCKDWMRSLVGS